MQRTRMQSANRRGMTLVEIVIALAVLAIALAGVIGALVHTMTANAIIRQENLARDAAMRKLDEARSKDYLVMMSAPPIGYSTSSASPTTFTVAELSAGLGEIWLDAYAPPISAISTIHVRVTWTSERGNRKYETSAIVTR